MTRYWVTTTDDQQMGNFPVEIEADSFKSAGELDLNVANYYDDPEDQEAHRGDKVVVVVTDEEGKEERFTKFLV